MAKTWLSALLLLCLSFAPSVQADDDFTPQLTTRFVDDGVKLQWTTPDGPRGQEIQNAEIWRYAPVVPDTADAAGAPGPGQWELYSVRNGVAPYFVDEQGRGDTFYFVRLVFLDGAKSAPSNPSSVDYPHCSWILLTVPPVLTTHCLFPPPFIDEFP